MSEPHFQYEGKMQSDRLFQGDVLKRTETLERALEELYPYVHENPKKYPYFVVLTQSCDFSPGNGLRHKADHITLAAVRSTHLYLKHEVSKLQQPLLKEVGVCLNREEGLLSSKG